MKRVSKIWAAFAGIALAVGIGGLSADAATYTNQMTCDVGDIGPTASFCWGRADDNVNDSETLLNTNVFLDDPFTDTTVLGIFNQTDWSQLQRVNTPGAITTETNIGLEVDPDGGGVKSGDWSFTADLSVVQGVMVILKAGPYFHAYLYDDTSIFSNGIDGTWDTTGLLKPNGQSSALSHLTVYARGIPPGGIVSPVPLPAAFPLFAGGLGLLGFLGWRRKRIAAA